jgi:hypothetical protein
MRVGGVRHGVIRLWDTPSARVGGWWGGGSVIVDKSHE